MRSIRLLLAAGTLCAVLGAPVVAQSAAPPAAPAGAELPALRVAAIVAPPFVMQENGALSGFNIELWNAITERLKRRTT